MIHPPVSVLLPFRNAEKYIDEALESISLQTFGDFEVVLVNDGSRDESAIIAGERCSEDPRFIPIESDGRGLVDALNTGLANCRGEWIARMDADDIALPGRIGKQYELALSEGSRTIVSCRVRSFPDDLVTDGYRNYENWLNALTGADELEKNLFVESPVPHPTAFFHRQMIIDAGGYSEKELPEDYELWLRWMDAGVRFGKVNEHLLDWNDHARRLTRTDTRYAVDAFYETKFLYLSKWLKQNSPQNNHVWIWGAGPKTRKRIRGIWLSERRNS